MNNIQNYYEQLLKQLKQDETVHVGPVTNNERKN